MINHPKIIDEFLSQPRFKPYVKVCKGDLGRAMDLYQLNIRMGASFLPLLSIFEIALRNATDQFFQAHFQNREFWFTDLRQILLNHIDQVKSKLGEHHTLDEVNKYQHPLSGTLRELENVDRNIWKKIRADLRRDIRHNLFKNGTFKSLNRVEQVLMVDRHFNQQLPMVQQQSLPLSTDLFIANTKFAFWTSLFRRESLVAIRGRQVQVFINRPRTMTMKKISRRLEDIRLFRNRIAHHEPLIFSRQQFTLKPAETIHQYIQELLQMLDQDLELFSQQIFLIHQNLRLVQDFIENIPGIVEVEKLDG